MEKPSRPSSSPTKTQKKSPGRPKTVSPARKTKKSPTRSSSAGSSSGRKSPSKSGSPFPSGTNGNIKMQRADSPKKKAATSKAKGSPKKGSPKKRLQKKQLERISESILRYGDHHNPYVKTSDAKKSKAPLETSGKSAVNDVAPYRPMEEPKNQPIVYKKLNLAVDQVIENLQKILDEKKDFDSPSDLAVVFDIDSTVLRVIDDEKTGESYATRDGIKEIGDIYQFALQHKMRIFFITARPDYKISGDLSNVQLTNGKLLIVFPP